MTRITDVAKAAGVSAATVSRVLNGHKVDSELAGRVFAAVEELGYVPNQTARNLRTQRSTTWAVVVSDIENPFFTSIVRGAEDVARQAGYSLVLANTEEDPEREAFYFETILNGQLAGVILVPSSEGHSDVSRLVKKPIPVVTADRRLASTGIDSVMVDNQLGAALAVRRLSESGRRRIACVTGPLSSTTGRARLEGYQRTVAELGLPECDELIEVADFREQGGYDAVARLASLAAPPDGLFIANNLMAIGALEALADLGVEVPSDVSVVSFDEIPWASLIQPSLTTIAQPAHEMGAEAARLLLRRIEDPGASVRHVVLKPELRIRKSG